jgi:hypothetical protein
MIWIFVVAALALSVYALRQPAPRAGLAGLLAALVYLPFALYLAASPGTRWLGPIAEVLYLAAALPLRRNVRWLAALLTLPAFIVAAYVAYLVLTQGR